MEYIKETNTIIRGRQNPSYLSIFKKLFFRFVLDQYNRKNIVNFEMKHKLSQKYEK